MFCGGTGSMVSVEVSVVVGVVDVVVGDGLVVCEDVVVDECVVRRRWGSAPAAPGQDGQAVDDDRDQNHHRQAPQG